MRAALHRLHALATPGFEVPELPAAYQILPQIMPFHIAGFPRDNHPQNRVLAPAGTPECDAWYAQFVSNLLQARGKRFVPVCRLSDGEFLFALGPQPPDIRRPLWARALGRVLQTSRHWLRRGHFSARTVGRYHSGDYNRGEWRSMRGRFAADVRHLGAMGVLGLHLSYGCEAFQERYFPALGAWLHTHNIILHPGNCVPSYFVYAALARAQEHGLLRGRVLAVNCAIGEKQARIVAGLRQAGADEILWCPISERRSLFDRIDVRPYSGRVDVAVVGAGIGKSNILRQMAPLAVPCIDAGFFFEIWADPSRASERPFCLARPEA